MMQRPLQYERWEFPGGQPDQRMMEMPPSDRTVTDYESGTQYETIVYGKGALFYDAIREEIGDRRFKEFLQDYLTEHRYDIVTVEEWRTALGKLGSPILVNLYEEWINNPPLDEHDSESDSESGDYSPIPDDSPR